MPVVDCTACYFNSRSRTGSDPFSFITRSCCVSISIHAPAQGATLCIRHTASHRPFISIHAPAQGATLRIHLLRSGENISIHAPAQGAT